MKKILALLLAAAICLTLVACGSKVEETVIGDWSGDFIYSMETIHANGNSKLCIAAGHNVTTTLSLFEGNALQITLHSNETGFEIFYNGTWEIKNGILVITYGTAAQAVSFIINTDTTTDTLTLQGISYIFPDTLTKR